MKKLFFVKLLLYIVILLTIIQPKLTLAQNNDSETVFNYKFPSLTSQPLPYVFKSYILLPADTLYSQRQIENEFKVGALKALRATHLMYKNKLGGKTFKFNETITVIKSDISLGDEIPKTAFGVFNKLGGGKLVPLENGVVNIIWVAGAGTRISGGAQIKQGSYNMGVVFMAESVLLDSTPVAQGVYASLALTHEIGHALGLAHPCTQESVEMCLKDATQPLPSGDEWYGIMGYGGITGGDTTLVDALSMNFNNSKQNPEINILFNNPFINPNNDPAPQVTASSTQSVKVDRIYPEQIEAGSEIQIFGSGLKNIKMVEAVFGGFSAKDLLFKTMEDDRIILSIPQDIVIPGASSEIHLRLKLTSGRIITLPKSYKISRVGFPPKIVTKSFATVCEEDGKELALSDVLVRMTVVVVDPYTQRENARGAAAISNKQGNGTLSYTVNYLHGQYKKAWLTGDPVFSKGMTGIIPNQQYFDIEENDQPIVFVYPKCPEWVDKSNDSLKNTDEKKPDNTQLEEVVIDNQNGEAVSINPDQPPEIVDVNSAGIPLNIKEIYSDGTVKEYEADLDDGDITTIGNIQIKSKYIKKAAKLKVNGEEIQLGSSDIDLENIIKEVELTDGQMVNGKYLVPIEVCFNVSEDDCIRTAYNFSLDQEAQPQQEIQQVEDDLSSEVDNNYEETGEKQIIGKCGDQSGQVVVQVSVDGGETPDIDCKEQGQVCQEYINDGGKQDARCVDSEQP